MKYEYSPEFAKAVAESYCKRDVFIKMGWPANGRHSYTRFDRYVSDHNIDTSHFTLQGIGPGREHKLKIANDDFFNYGARRNGTALKKRMLEEGTPNNCAICHLTEWQGQPIVLEVDHKDGDSKDNRRHNLRLLCPNCHSQTPTFRSRNRGNAWGKQLNSATAHGTMGKVTVSTNMVP